MALIYVVEDDANIREIETIALKNGGHTVEGASCARELFEKIEEKVPDLAIVDIMLPDKDGYEIVKELRGNLATAHLPIIMVTAKSTEMDMVKGLDIGADDYIKKPFSVMELITRVRALLRRTRNLESQKIFSVGKILLDDERRAVYVCDKNVELTYKEYELLRLFMANPGIVLTRNMIMQKVWDTDFEGESRTVDMHIKTLRQKLLDEGGCIKTVRNVGYVMELKDEKKI